MIFVNNLYKGYTTNGRACIEVLKGLFLDVREGDFVVISGPSGVGKSTLLHIIGLLDDPDKGDVVFGDECVTRLSSRKKAFIRGRKIGFIFQFYNLLADLTLLENIYLAYFTAYNRFFVPRKIKEWIEYLIRFVGLEKRVSHKPYQLSGGEQQRVAIVRALVNKPLLVLADEPTGNLDTETAKNVWALLLKFNKELKQTMIVVTHNEELAEKATVHFKMRAGRLWKAE